MPRTVRGGLIQVKADVSLDGTTDDIKQRMIDKTLPLVEDMVADFAHLIEAYGHIPNGTRTYYLSRSQPPF